MCFLIDWRGCLPVRAHRPLHVIWIRSTRFPQVRLKGPLTPLGRSRRDGHGDCGQAARLRRISDAVPFFGVVSLISRVSFDGSPHVVFSLSLYDTSPRRGWV